MLACMLTILWAASAWAQAFESKTSVGATGHLWGDESSLGKGWLVGSRADRVLFGTTRAEVAVEVLFPNLNLVAAFLFGSPSTLLSAGLEHRFGRGHAQPYARGGALQARHSGGRNFARNRRSRTGNDAGFYVGGGIVVRVRERLEIGPDARVIVIGTGNDQDPTWIYTIGLRVAWRI